MIVDAHTHRPDARDAVIAVDPRQWHPLPGLCYAVGYHPWSDLTTLTSDDWSLLERLAAHPQVVAIGETGMDRTRGGDLAVQRAALARHLRVAHDHGLPVVIHAVRTSRDVLDCRQGERLCDVPLIIHGMRGNPNVARALLDAGCVLSYGPRFNAATVAATPLDRLLLETDDDCGTSIAAVATAVAAVLHLPADQLLRHASENAMRIFARAPLG